jgi:hypothetical protein
MALSTVAPRGGMVTGMREPNLEELRIADTLQDNQSGALNAFNRSPRLRHAQLGSWWERVLAVLSLIFVVVTVFNLVIRNL